MVVVLKKKTNDARRRFQCSLLTVRAWNQRLGNCLWGISSPLPGIPLIWCWRGVTLIGHQYTQSRGALSACWPNKCFPPNIGGDWERKKYYTIFRGQEGGGGEVFWGQEGKKIFLGHFFMGIAKYYVEKNLQSSNCCPGSKIPFFKNNKNESNQFCCG